jgi:CheY-like chemotaxis protein
MAGRGAEALEILRQSPCDCVVLDLKLPDMSGFDVLEKIRDDAALSDLPVVVFTGRALSAEEDVKLHTMARSVVVKGVESPERLLDETALFLHRVVDLPAAKQQMIERLQLRRVCWARPLCWSITIPQHLCPQRAGAPRHEGADGHHRQWSWLIDAPNDIAIVLMDIMMPGMDGYQTCR